MAFLYVILCVGALTTLFPFLLMVSTGLKGPTDQSDNKLVPAYLADDAELLAKYVDDKYAGNASMVASTRSGPTASAGDIDTYRRFLAQLPNDYWTAGFRTAPNQVTSRLARRYQAWLRSRYHDDIDALNKRYIEENVDFGTIEAPAELFERKVWKPAPGTKWAEWQEFKRALPIEFRIPVRTQRLWQEFVRAKYRNRFTDVPIEVVGKGKVFEDLDIPTERGLQTAQGPQPSGWTGRLWKEFLSQSIPERFRTNPVEGQWEAFTSQGVPDAMAGQKLSPKQMTAARSSLGMPIEADERQWAAAHTAEIRREFAGRNYDYVLDYILLHGRALWNTVLFCLLAISTQLVVNPLAAYALSRYPVRQSGKILLFLLATMAFPAEVAMIPSFLLLKDLGLLNTFAALVMPGAASGFMIFLLKGFFDSLPQELFEAGSMDGAKETTMLLRIALPLSKPVLGYLALLAFMGAYGSFLYAFLIAQDQRMWTLMVYVYQLQNLAPKSVMMAALTLAALPTLIVFLFAQRVIMRGIVLPGER
jgi:multiple sugar transport system permease protein